MTAKKKNMIRETLRNKLRELELDGHAADIQVERFAESMEGAQQQSTLEPALSVINAEWEMHEAIEDALHKLESGDYGICEECGEPIGAKRLAAVPWAPRCFACQQEREDGSFSKVA